MRLGMKNYNILGIPEESDFEGGVVHEKST